MVSSSHTFYAVKSVVSESFRCSGIFPGSDAFYAGRCLIMQFIIIVGLHHAANNLVV